MATRTVAVGSWPATNLTDAANLEAGNTYVIQNISTNGRVRLAESTGTPTDPDGGHKLFPSSDVWWKQGQSLPIWAWAEIGQQRLVITEAV